MAQHIIRKNFNQHLNRNLKSAADDIQRKINSESCVS